MEHPVLELQVRLTLLNVIHSVEQKEHQQPVFALKDLPTNYSYRVLAGKEHG